MSASPTARLMPLPSRVFAFDYAVLVRVTGEKGEPEISFCVVWWFLGRGPVQGTPFWFSG